MASNALAVIKPENLTVENIPQLRQANFLVVGPTDQVAQLNDYFAMRLTHVPVDTALDTYKNPTGPDLWKVPGGKYAPTKVLLIKMASAAGITWDTRETKRIDSGNDKRFCQYQAIGRMRLPSGEIIEFKDSATEDADVIEEEITEKWLEKMEAGDTYEIGVYPNKKRVPLTREVALDKAKKEFRAYYKFMHERCMSRAMNRAIRQVLALNGTYTIDQLSKGFVVPQVNFSPNLNDPRTREMMALAAAGKLRQMFGGESEQPTEAPKAIAAPPEVDAFTGEVETQDATLTEAEIAAATNGLDSAMVATFEELEEDGPDIEAEMITDQQVIAMGAECTRLFNSTKEGHQNALVWISSFVGRQVVTRKALTKDEASRILNVLSNARSAEDLKGALHGAA